MNRIDLCISGNFDFLTHMKTLSIDRVGAPFDEKIYEGVVYRLGKAPQHPARYPYLIVSEVMEESADIIAINNFHRVKEKLKKKVKKGTGLEVKIALARKMDGASIGKWFEGLRDLHSFCRSSKCQFILSSGARSLNEMVSGRSLDAILRNCDIEPYEHWREMNTWLQARLSRRVSI